MSVIDSDEEMDYTIKDIDSICHQEDDINLEDLLSTGADDKELITNEKEINNIIYDINLGQDIISKFDLASETNTPINFIFRDREDNYFSLFNKLEGEEEMVETFNYYNRKFNLTIESFLLAYFIANKDAKRSFIIEKINYLSRVSNLVLDEENFDDNAERYESKLVILNKKTLEEYKKIKEFYQDLSKMSYSTSPEEISQSLKLTETKVVIKVNDGEYDFNVDTGAIIFNNMNTSYYFPFIQYQGEEDKFYKLYDKENLVIEEVINVNKKINILSEEEKDKRKNYIFVLMRLPLVNGEKYILLEFNLEKSKVIFSYPGNTIEVVKKKLPSLLEDIILGPEEILNIRGNFEINFPNYDNTKLYFLSLFEKVFNKFLYVKEESKPRSLVSERDKFYFKTYTEEKSSRGYKANFFIEPLYGDKYSIIFRSSTVNGNSLNEFSLIMSKLAWYYNHLDNEELNMNYELVTEPYTGPDGKGLGAPLSEKKERNTFFRTNKIDNLITAAPQIFPKSEYSRRCGCPRQPIIIGEEDVADWQEYEFDGKKHNVVKFPPSKSEQGGKRFNFVCPSENNILSFIPNPDQLSEYPILPCCSVKKNDLYDRYDEIRTDPLAFFNEREEAKGKTSQLKTVKMLTTDQVGFLPTELQSFLKRAHPNTQFTRAGVLKNSKSSMIHCALLASGHLANLKDKSKNNKLNEKLDKLIKFRKVYLEKNIIKREQIVNIMRKNLYKFVELISASQENFNLSEKQLELRIANNEEVFDSHYYYKLLENIFHINIFVFVYEDGKINLERPHHRFFHNREINRSLPTLLLFKHVSSKTFPIYELIGHDGTVKGSDFPYLYTDILTKFINNYIDKNPYYICESHRDEDYTVRVNYYQNINWNYLLADYEIVGQAINDSGRIYRINIMVDEQELSVYVPPSFPLNVPLRDKIACGTKKLAIDIFEASSQEGCGGMWFKMNGCDKAIFVPCQDVKKNKDPCVAYELEKEKKISDNNFYQINVINRNANIIKQLIIWCWNLSNLESIDDWFSRYIIRNDNNTENGTFNNMPISINYRFPLNIDDSEAGIKYLSYYVPIIFRNGQIHLYNQLYDAIKQYLLNYKAMTYGLPKVANKGIINAFSNEQDFKDMPFTRIIVGERNWQEWVNFVTVGEIIRQQIEEEDSNKIRPFTYQNEKGHIYLIQNNVEGKIDVALLISKVWANAKINLGYYTTNINIWNCLERDVRILETAGLTREAVMARANQISDRVIKTFCDAVQFLDRNEIKYEDKRDCHYLLHKQDGSFSKEGNCKNEFQELYQYDNGIYASMLRII